MNRRRTLAVVGMVGLAVTTAWLATLAVRSAGAHEDHEYPPVPTAYANAHVPTRVWTDPQMIARGKEIRWAVIVYSHTLSGHRGPHDAGEHPELGPKPKFVTGEGTVVAVRPDRQQIVVEHGKIEQFMDAMTMGYKVASLSLLDKVKPGDRVRFTIDTGARAITKLDKLND